MAQKQSSLLAKRYASALVDLAEKEKAVAQIEKDMGGLAAALDESEDLETLFHSLTISKTEQMDAIEALAKKSGYHKLTINFIKTLIQNRRTGAIRDIIAAVYAEVAERKGLVNVNVTVAEDLSAAQRKDLTAALEKSLGHNVNVQLKIDPSIIGGLIVTAGSYMVDHSVRRKLERLQNAMSGHSNQNFNTIKKEA